MSYVLFLIVFLGIPLAGLIYLMRGSLQRIHLVMLAGVATASVIYTTPWANYLVATRVWYYDPQLILGIPLGYVPVEVYAFFALQALLIGLFALWTWRRFYPVDFAEKSGSAPAPEQKPKRER
jgi:lycopene beta-cyclase